MWSFVGKSPLSSAPNIWSSSSSSSSSPQHPIFERGVDVRSPLLCFFHTSPTYVAMTEHNSLYFYCICILHWRYTFVHTYTLYVAISGNFVFHTRYYASPYQYPIARVFHSWDIEHSKTIWWNPYHPFVRYPFPDAAAPVQDNFGETPLIIFSFPSPPALALPPAGLVLTLPLIQSTSLIFLDSRF